MPEAQPQRAGIDNDDFRPLKDENGNAMSQQELLLKEKHGKARNKNVNKSTKAFEECVRAVMTGNETNLNTSDGDLALDEGLLDRKQKL